jgi:hypothetical protein
VPPAAIDGPVTDRLYALTEPLGHMWRVLA